MKKNQIISMKERPRRNRRSQAIRDLIQENLIAAESLVMPLFVLEGKKKTIAVPSMPGIEKLSLDLLLSEVETLMKLGIQSVALFPSLPDAKKDKLAKESWNPKGLFPRAIRQLKKNFPELCVITDVAMDPYSSDGHDGLVRKG